MMKEEKPVEERASAKSTKTTTVKEQIVIMAENCFNKVVMKILKKLKIFLIKISTYWFVFLLSLR